MSVKTCFQRGFEFFKDILFVKKKWSILNKSGTENLRSMIYESLILGLFMLVLAWNLVLQSYHGLANYLFQGEQEHGG